MVDTPVIEIRVLACNTQMTQGGAGWLRYCGDLHESPFPEKIVLPVDGGMEVGRVLCARSHGTTLNLLDVDRGVAGSLHLISHRHATVALQEDGTFTIELIKAITFINDKLHCVQPGGGVETVVLRHLDIITFGGLGLENGADEYRRFQFEFNQPTAEQAAAEQTAARQAETGQAAARRTRRRSWRRRSSTRSY